MSVLILSCTIVSSDFGCKLQPETTKIFIIHGSRKSPPIYTQSVILSDDTQFSIGLGRDLRLLTSIKWLEATVKSTYIKF